jgi:catecholate siderophore receptor
LLAGISICNAETGGKFQLSGRVVDQNGAVIAGAQVSAESKKGPGAFTVATDQNGEFVIELAPGEYNVTITAAGFTRSRHSVSIGSSNYELPRTVLQVGAPSAIVTVGDTANYKAESITSATKTNTPMRDIPQSISAITKEQIKDQAIQSIGDAVRYVPGLSAHQGENNRDQVIIRGQSSSADFFLNGVRDDVQYYRDPYNMERLETLKGPNAMIFGRGGGGGVINRVTKEAHSSPFREVMFTGGSYYNRRVSGDINQPINDIIAFRFNGVAENSDSFRDFVNLKRLAFNPTFTITPSDSTQITIGYEYARDRRTADRGITSYQGRIADVPISTFYGNPDDSHVASNVNIVSGSIDHQIGKLNIHNRTSYGDYDRFYQNYVPGAVNAAKTLVTLTAYNNATRRKNLFNQTDLTYTVSTGDIQHTLLGGFELGRQLTDNFRQTGFFNNTTTSITTPYNDPTNYTPVTFRQSATDANNHLTTGLAAAYVQDQVQITRFVQVVAGVRYDYFDLKYHNNRNNDNLRRIDSLLSPRFGIVIKPVNRLSLYGNYSVSYLPSSGDQFSSLTAITQQVKPEKFTNFEAGLKWDIRRNIFLTSAIYRLDRTNTRSIDPNNPAAIIQTGSQRTDGFEIGLSGNITSRWSMSGGYNYQDARITSATAAAAAGKQVGQVPHHTFSIWNKYQFLSRLGAGVGLIRRSDMFVAVDNTVTLPGYARADAAVYYTFNERWMLQANVENLLNTRYILNADSNTNISPGSPRAIRVSLVANF